MKKTLKKKSKRIPTKQRVKAEKKLREHASFALASWNIPRAEESVQAGNIVMTAGNNTILNCTAILRKETPPPLNGEEIVLPTTTATKPPDNSQDRPRTDLNSPILTKFRVCLTTRTFPMTPGIET